MKKSQRHRFFALIGKQSSGATLTAAELTDLRTLSALVSAHPSAAEDTDDTEETDEEKKKREEKEAADKKAEEDEKKKKDEEAKAKASAKPGVSARLAAAMAGLSGASPAAITAELQQARQDLAKCQADLATTQAALKASEAVATTLCDFFGLKAEDVAGKTQADIDAICTAKISAAATAQLAGLGIAPGKLPKPNGGTGTANTIEELQAEMANTKDPEALGKLAAKANALRDKPAV